MRTVRYSDVNVGDDVLDRSYFNRTDPFQRVTDVHAHPTYVELFLGVSVNPTIDTRTIWIGHPNEGVTIR